MPSPADRSHEAARLHRRARSVGRGRLATATGDADTRRLLHELEIHQIELETQNAEIERARAEIEAALERYTELYDFAPVGYLSVDRQGLIQEVNLTGAAMFAVVRSRLLRRPLAAFVAPTSRRTIVDYLEESFAQPGSHVCEVLLRTSAGATFWANLHSATTAGSDRDRPWCRVAIANISVLKGAEAARRRVEELSIAMASANREIVRRRAAEKLLQESERQQRELRETAQELHAQLRRLTHQILLAQEEERKAISRQLHDEIAQLLAGVGVHLAALTAAADDPKKLRRRLSATRLLVAQSIKVVHDFARDLRPTMLDDLGLVPALRSFVKSLARQHRLRIRFTVVDPLGPLDTIRRTVLYRVAQEALTNVVRHAGARRVSVILRQTGEGIRLEVHDDGHSFPAAQLLTARHSGHLGLLGMRERVEMVGGRFAIDAVPGKGTLVTAEIPADPAAGSTRAAAPAD